MMCMKKSNGNEREKRVNNKHKHTRKHTHKHTHKHMHKHKDKRNMKSEIHMEYFTYSEAVFSFRILCTVFSILSHVSIALVAARHNLLIFNSFMRKLSINGVHL